MSSTFHVIPGGTKYSPRFAVMTAEHRSWTSARDWKQLIELSRDELVELAKVIDQAIDASADSEKKAKEP